VKETRHACKLGKIKHSPPGPQVLKYYAYLLRRSCSIITQLCTGHVGLNGFLHHINVVESPLCPHCHTHKIVEHFLLQCRQFTDKHHQLHITLHKSPDLCMLLGDPKNIYPLLTFVHATEHFPTYRNHYDATTEMSA
jgi:hypothetical protein